MRVDALWLATDRRVVGPAASFDRLPYVDAVTGHDVNSAEPNLSGAILSVPFEESLVLRAGVHLHWSLPDALTRLVHGTDGDGSGPEGDPTSGPAVDLPRVPNRWLVTRTGVHGDVARWVVDSDALSDIDRGGVAHPLLPGDPPGPTGRPWRYLGRALPLSAWPGPPTDRLAALTALGYGEPTFAAFYPNSHSVFGFHDNAFGGGTAPPAGTSFDVVGWYDDSSDDELLAALATSGGRAWEDVIAEVLGWSVPNGGGGPSPDGMLCFGRLTFAGNANAAPPPGPGARAETGVWVANTATEALAAHLGATLPGVREDDMEELLEALTVAGELENAALDLPIRLAQARHTGSFGPVPAGTMWTIGRVDEPLAPAAGTSDPVTAAQRQARETLALPEEIDDLLAALNDAQAAYDEAIARVTGLRGRLFADWHRYLACAYPPEQARDDYPDPDLVAAYLRSGVRSLTALLSNVGTWPPAGSGTSLAHRLRDAQRAVEHALAAVNEAAAARSRYELQRTPDAPYYLPNEPVVLLTGDAATPSDRYGRDGADQPGGLLPCAVLDVPDLAAADLSGAGGVTLLGTQMAATTTKLLAAAPDHPALRTWTGQPWHPVVLQWEVEFFPTREGNNLDPSGPDFDPKFITANYRLPGDDLELRPRTGAGPVDKGANVYTGSTVLSAATRPLLATRILTYLRGTPLARCNDERRAAGRPVLTAEQLDADPRPLLDWCLTQDGDPRLRALAAAHDHLATHESSNLAQSLGGFNEALLMLRMVRQLPIGDPLGFPSGEALATLMAAAVAGEGRLAPVPLSDFNPIRAGALRLRQLRIVDSFGIGHDVDVSRPRTTIRLRMGNRPTWVAMPPRLAVPARLELRWLDAERPERPITGLPEASPVCGWLLPDVLDDGLRVYATTGAWLGTLYPVADAAQPDQARWEPAPTAAVPDVAGIDNPRLRAVVARLRGLGPTGLAEFLVGLENALDAVEPEDPTQHRERATLTGRPIAVGRLRVDLQAAGPPAIHQDWNVFRQDLGRVGRETNQYPLVRFPVRLGERGRLGDGMLGYWLEGTGGELAGPYHDIAVLAEADADPPLEVAIDLPAQSATVLVEPAGAIHATTGILPTVALRLDAAHHQKALAAMETGFLAAPVLTDADRVALVPPATQPGRAWSWRERDGSGWVEVVDPPYLRDAFPSALTAREGWLSLRDQPAQSPG